MTDHLIAVGYDLGVCSGYDEENEDEQLEVEHRYEQRRGEDRSDGEHLRTTQQLAACRRRRAHQHRI